MSRRKKELDREWCLKWSKKIKAINYLGGKCIKCGNKNIFQLCFHHINEKDFNIATLLSSRWSKVLSELDKCNILCSNCHQELHHPDGNSFKRNILEDNKQMSCEKCGYTSENLSSLSFHHRDPKLKKVNVAHMFRSWRMNYSLKTITDEINKCDLICINCHRLEEIDLDRFEKNHQLIYDFVNGYKEPNEKVDEDLVVKLSRSGFKNGDISKKMNIGTSTVSRVLKKYGLIKKNIDKKEIIRLHDSGWNGIEISKKLGCTDPYVYTVLKENKLEKSVLLIS